MAVAGDDEAVRLYDLQKMKCVCEFKAHETRVKAVDSVMMDDYCVLVTASNDGFIKMWKLHLKEALECPTLLGEVNTEARLTCLTVWKLSSAQEISEKTDKSEATTSAELVQELSKTKRVRIMAEEVILEDESKPKKKKKDLKK